MPLTIPLTVDMIWVLSLLVFIILLTWSDFIRVDVVALFILVILGISRLLPPEQLFSGFSSDAAISLIAIMIVSAGLEKSGIALRIAKGVLRLGRERPNQINVVLMVTSGFLSAFMRSLGTVALLLPVVNKVSARAGLPKSHLLMPIAFCAVLGGMLSMIGSNALILLNGLLSTADVHLRLQGYSTGLKTFSMLSVFPIGCVLLLLGITYFVLFGKRLLPKAVSQVFSAGSTKKHFSKTYGKGVDIFELNVLKNSSLIGLTVQEIESRLDPKCSVLAVISGKTMHFPALRRIIVDKGYSIALMGNKDEILKFAQSYSLKLETQKKIFNETLHPARSGLCEAVIPPSSQLIGLPLRELHMKRNYHIQVLAVYRGQTVYRGEELKSLILASGDTLGMFCEWQALSDFHKNPDFVVVTTAYPREEIRSGKVVYALLFFIVPFFLIILGDFPVSVGLLVGAAGMVATGVLSIDEAYESVSWKSVFLMAGLIPLGIAMQSTQTTDWLTQQAAVWQGDLPHWVIQMVLAVVSGLAAFVLSAVGATIVLVPIAIDLAINTGADPAMYALIVAMGSNNSFLRGTQQANTLIAGPGGYTSADFWRVGSGMSVLYLVGMLLMINLCFG